MQQRNIIALTLIVGLAFTTVLAAGRASGAAQAKITLQRSQGVEYGSGEAVVSDHRQSRWLEECEPLKAVGKPPAT